MEKIKNPKLFIHGMVNNIKIFSRVIYIFIIVNVCMLTHVVWRLR